MERVELHAQILVRALTRVVLDLAHLHVPGLPRAHLAVAAQVAFVKANVETRLKVQSQAVSGYGSIGIDVCEPHLAVRRVRLASGV